MTDGAHDQGVTFRFRSKEEERGKKSPPSPPVGAGIFGIFGFYSLPIRRAAFPGFVPAKGRLIRPRGRREEMRNVRGLLAMGYLGYELQDPLFF